MLNTNRYITYSLSNPIAAINYMKNIKDKISSLKYLPYRGALSSKSNTRNLIYKNYLIFYEIQEKQKIVRIKRVIHSKVNKNEIY